VPFVLSGYSSEGIRIQFLGRTDVLKPLALVQHAVEQG
jgi:hypothetical protein